MSQAGRFIKGSSPGPFAAEFIEDSGTAVPNGAGQINVLGAGGITTSGSGNTITITGSGSISETYDTDSGTATPIANVIDIAGGLNMNTAGATNVVTINLDTSINQPSTSADGTMGMYSLNNDNFMHSFGANATFLGINAGNLTYTGNGNNTGIGNFALTSITDAEECTAVGAGALNALTSSQYVTAVGYNAGQGSADAATNGTFIGALAGANTNAADNTFVGYNCGGNNSTGVDNTGLGSGALAGLTSGINNVGIGFKALNAGSSLSSCTAVGFYAGLVLSDFATSNLNTVIGYASGSSLVGANNTFVGANSGFGFTTGTENTSLGSGSFIAIGLTGTGNIGIGYDIGSNYTTSESYNILLGSSIGGTLGESNVMRLGPTGGAAEIAQTFIGGIYGVTVSSPSMVTIDSVGQLGSASIPSSSISITGDSGGALSGNAFTLTGGSTGLTFAGSGTTETLGGELVVANGGTGVGSFTQYGVLVGNGTSALAVTAAGTTGQVLTANTGANPTWGAAPASFTWSVITTGQTMAVGNGYIVNAAGTATLLLPAVSAAGAVIEVAGINNATGWSITQAAGQQIHFGTIATTSGTGGSLSSSATNDCVKIVCTVANTTWQVTSSIGNITYV